MVKINSILLVLAFGIVLTININWTFARPTAETEEGKTPEGEDENKKEEEETGTEDRLNLNMNRGHAHAVGPYGSFSGSDAETYGIEAGIRGPGFHRPLYSQTGGRGSSYAQGPYAPTTYANGNTRFGNGYMGGNAGAGFYGGQGVANVDSRTHHIEIPLDPYGTVFYSNLKDKTKNKNKSDQPQKSSESLLANKESKEDDGRNDSATGLVFQ